MKQTFESAILVQLFPRSQIDIYVQVLQSDGGGSGVGVDGAYVMWRSLAVALAMIMSYLLGDLSVCINAATLAVIDAGIPMKDYVCACTASYIEDCPFVGELMTFAHTSALKL